MQRRVDWLDQADIRHLHLLACRDPERIWKNGKRLADIRRMQDSIGGISVRHVREFILKGRCHMHFSLKVAESAISALVQSNFLMSFMVGIQSIASIKFSSADLVSMAVSIGISCFSAGLSFASRDKMDSAVLGLPGKIGWGPTMCCLVAARSLEVGSKMFAFNLHSRGMASRPCGRPHRSCVLRCRCRAVLPGGRADWHPGTLEQAMTSEMLVIRCKKQLKADEMLNRFWNSAFWYVELVAKILPKLTIMKKHGKTHDVSMDKSTATTTCNEASYWVVDESMTQHLFWSIFDPRLQW